MCKTFEVFADEAWTHNNPLSLRRYWCFLGGVFGTSEDMDRLHKPLAKIKNDYGLKGEVKWKRIDVQNIDAYKALINCFFTFLDDDNSTIRYRQMHLDRSFVSVEAFQRNQKNLYSLDVQFKVYYQFLKHHFGFKYLPERNAKIFIKLDDHSSHRHKKELEKFSNELPNILERKDLTVSIKYVKSSKHLRLQICDLLMGAAGSHGNKGSEIRKLGQRGMTQKQKVRHDFCKFVYNKFKVLNKNKRGAGAFNWFESTGIGSDMVNRYEHKARFWKFIPRMYYKDKGWENDHLVKGVYQGPDIDTSKIFSAN